MCSRDVKSKRAIRLGATKDTREIFSLSTLFLCCLCEIQCAIMARTDPSFDMPLLEFSSDLSKRFLHCSCEQFICLYFFQIVLLVYCLSSRQQLSIQAIYSYTGGLGLQEVFCGGDDGGVRASVRPARDRSALHE